MIHLAIVEDDAQSSEQLQAFLRRYRQEQGTEMKISCFSDGEQIVRNYEPCYDIILMDVEMEHLDGMTAAELIRHQDPEVIIIFITNMAQYAIRGYAVDALDYVLKPVSYFAFSQRLNRALARIDRNKTHYITVPVKGGAQKLDISHIFYVESVGHNLIFHTRKEDVLTTGTLKEMEELLEPYGFSKCNKGYLVNLEHVDAVRDGSAVVDGTPLLISRGRKNAFLEQLANYMGGRTR